MCGNYSTEKSAEQVKHCSEHIRCHAMLSQANCYDTLLTIMLDLGLCVIGEDNIKSENGLHGGITSFLHASILRLIYTT